MNKENIRATIEMMRHVADNNGEVNMDSWFGPNDRDTVAFLDLYQAYADREAELGELETACGSAACVAGWTSLTREWIDQGFRVDVNYQPEGPDGEEPFEAMARFWDVPHSVAEALCDAESETLPGYAFLTRNLSLETITTDVVIEALEALLEFDEEGLDGFQRTLEMFDLFFHTEPDMTVRFVQSDRL